MPIELTSTENLTLFAAAFLIAGFVKGTTGMGFSTTALAILAVFIGVKPALPLMIIPSFISNIIVMVEVGQFRPVFKRFRLLFLLTIPGVILGLVVLANSEPTTSSVVLGVIIVMYSLSSLFRPDFLIPEKFEKPFGPIVGFLTGFLNGMTGSQVMPILPFLVSLCLSREQFIQAMNISFSLCTVFMVIGLFQLGLITVETMTISLVGILPMVVGLKLGSRVRQMISPRVFRVIVLLFLIFAGILLIAK